MTETAFLARIPEGRFDVVEGGAAPRDGFEAFDLESAFKVDMEALRSYAFAQWEPLLYDAMVLAAAVEYADRSVLRPDLGWTRRLSLQIPVHEPKRWNEPETLRALHDTLRFLTGDEWSISFTQSSSDPLTPHNGFLSLPINTQAVIAFSDGMDSRAVSTLLGHELGTKLVRVRVGPKIRDVPTVTRRRAPFTSVPYTIKIRRSNKDTSARSRGFKFALVSGIAAYLTGATEIIIPESGQGAIGPALVKVGHAYPDFRNHPSYTARMERFLSALLGFDVRYVFPRIWNTKGETLREYQSVTGDQGWLITRSCWRGNQWSSVNGSWRQCGVCAACMLRRLSVHAAGLVEPRESYICTNMHAPTLQDAVDPDFNKLNRAYEWYAIAGVLHLDHLADMSREDSRFLVQRHALTIAEPLGISAKDAEAGMARMLERHAGEWRDYLDFLGTRSFVKQWVRSV